MTKDIISINAARTLSGLFRERVSRTPDAVAYRLYNDETNSWENTTWLEMNRSVARWRAALASENLAPGDRVALMLKNSREWVLFDQAALSLGLVVVPIFPNDRPSNVAYILNNADVKVLLVSGPRHWNQLHAELEDLSELKRVITLKTVSDVDDERHRNAEVWLPDEFIDPPVHESDPHDLATIVYTSGTTGKPKGVMLSHYNIIWNANTALGYIDVYREDLFLSFLPLSHMLERTVGYYLPIMSGSTVAYNRSIPQLAEDILAVRPTALISVPRIYERIYNRIVSQLENQSTIARVLFSLTIYTGWKRFKFQQKRGAWSPLFLLWPLLNSIVARKITARMGGRLRVSLCGGAALSQDVARLFIGLGMKLLQGYGLTETSPVISVNTIEDNIPDSVGMPLEGIDTMVSSKYELLVRGPGNMMGYWKNEKATRDMIDNDGWMHTGDKVKIEKGHIFITGRLKEIIVMVNGENVPPSDIESAIVSDVMFEQACLVGDNRPFLSVIVVLNQDEWAKLADKCFCDPDDAASLNNNNVKQAVLKRIAKHLRDFPGYAKIMRVILELDPWTIDNGLLTPTLKLRRNKVMSKYQSGITEIYKGH